MSSGREMRGKRSATPLQEVCGPSCVDRGDEKVKRRQRAGRDMRFGRRCCRTEYEGGVSLTETL